MACKPAPCSLTRLSIWVLVLGFVSLLKSFSADLLWAKYASWDDGSGGNPLPTQTISVDSEGSVYVGFNCPVSARGPEEILFDSTPRFGKAKLGYAVIAKYRADSTLEYTWAKETFFSSISQIDALPDGRLRFCGSDYILVPPFSELVGMEGFLTANGSLESLTHRAWTSCLTHSALTNAAALVSAAGLPGLDPETLITAADGSYYGVGKFEENEEVLGLTSAGNNDAYLCKLNSNGEPIWAVQIGSKTDDAARVPALGPGGKLYVAGKTGRNGIVLGKTLAPDRLNSFFTACIDTTGSAVAPSVRVEPMSHTLRQGEPIELPVAVNGEAPLYFQWQKDGGDIPNMTNRVFRKESSELSDAGEYRVRIHNSGGEVLSEKATIVVLPTPAGGVRVRPSFLTLNPGGSGSLAAEGPAEGAWQWHKEGVPIDGETNAVLNFANANVADIGQYTVEQQSDGANRMSLPATVDLSVPLPAPVPSFTYTTPGSIGSHYFDEADDCFYISGAIYDAVRAWRIFKVTRAGMVAVGSFEYTNSYVSSITSKTLTGVAGENARFAGFEIAPYGNFELLFDSELKVKSMRFFEAFFDSFYSGGALVKSMGIGFLQPDYEIVRLLNEEGALVRTVQKNPGGPFSIQLDRWNHMYFLPRGNTVQCRTPTGAEAWTRSATGALRSKQVDATGNTYIAGDFNSSLFWSGEPVSENPAGYYNFAMKVNSSGSIEWIKEFERGYTHDSFWELVPDELGNSYALGYFVAVQME